jgi:hypothetical protein
MQCGDPIGRKRTLIMGELKSSREFLVRTEKDSLKSDETRLINPIVLWALNKIK